MFQIDATQLTKHLQQVISKLPNAVEAGLTEAAETGAQLAKTKTFYKVRSPQGLQGKTHAQSFGPLSKGIIADTFYASWVNAGNAPPGTKIFPKRAKALRFVIDGKVIFRKWVNASQPKPFMTNTLQFEIRHLPEAVGRSIQRMLERL